MSAVHVAGLDDLHATKKMKEIGRNLVLRMGASRGGAFDRVRRFPPSSRGWLPAPGLSCDHCFLSSSRMFRLSCKGCWKCIPSIRCLSSIVPHACAPLARKIVRVALHPSVVNTLIIIFIYYVKSGRQSVKDCHGGFVASLLRSVYRAWPPRFLTAAAAGQSCREGVSDGGGDSPSYVLPFML
jgi:hypothetical protein